MSDFTIEGFWKKRLDLSPDATEELSEGWFQVNEAVQAFKEAPLELSSEIRSDTNPDEASLILVSAPGAVGKTTLAKEIAYRTGAIYVDLAQSEPVGGNTLAGSLVMSGIFDRWQAQSTTVLVDGLDEARLRVTQEGFEAFLANVATLSANRDVPAVLFGRSRSVQDAWLILAVAGMEVPVLEIGYFGPEMAVEFAEAKLYAADPNRSHNTADRQALELLLERLRQQTDSDGDRFAGYAPVLQAVAERVAMEKNPGALISQIESGAQPVTLQDVAIAILERERAKLEPLNFEDPELLDQLYLKDEQLGRLAARVYGDQPPSLPAMNATDTQTYENVLETWVADHPFLDGQDRPSSEVFDAVIASWTLRKGASIEAREAAVNRELNRGFAANPFLSEIYVNDFSATEDNFLPPDHVGIIYSSLRARLSLGDTASLLVDGAEDGDDAELLRAEVEITYARKGEERPRTIEFQSEQVGSILLGIHVEDVEIAAPYADVDIGAGSETTLVAPISIQCSRISIRATKLVVEPSPSRSENSVYLEAATFDGPMLTSVPVLREPAILAANWPSVRSHPWTNFATDTITIEDSKGDEALRRLRKFVISFRSHGQGRLARFKGKIEHRRMTKGTGQAVLNLMIDEKILSTEQAMYFLDSDRLAEIAGANYSDCVARRFGAKAIEFVQRAL